MQPIDREQTHRSDDLVRAGLHDLDAEANGDVGRDDDEERQHEEQRGRVWERVPDALDPVQEAGALAGGGRARVRAHGCASSRDGSARCTGACAGTPLCSTASPEDSKTQPTPVAGIGRGTARRRFNEGLGNQRV